MDHHEQSRDRRKSGISGHEESMGLLAEAQEFELDDMPGPSDRSRI